MRRATGQGRDLFLVHFISIHALLAESDSEGSFSPLSPQEFLSTLSLRRATLHTPCSGRKHRHFYPRSPCGERLVTRVRDLAGTKFLSTLSLRRATPYTAKGGSTMTISIHALLAESDDMSGATGRILRAFLSTLSLRRATARRASRQHPAGISIHALLAESDLSMGLDGRFKLYFYPRSPCGERPLRVTSSTRSHPISIHALLAESDRYLINTYHRIFGISIHALLAESDLTSVVSSTGTTGFLSTLSLRRATNPVLAVTSEVSDFYPRSPCGERLAQGADSGH